MQKSHVTHSLAKRTYFIVTLHVNFQRLEKLMEQRAGLFEARLSEPASHRRYQHRFLELARLLL